MKAITQFLLWLAHWIDERSTLEHDPY